MSDIDVWQDELVAAEAGLKRLREALEAVEWFKHDNDALSCPWCRSWPPEHRPDCQRQAALEPAP